MTGAAASAAAMVLAPAQAADRDRQRLQLRADAPLQRNPMRPATPAAGDGLALFDAARSPTLPL